MPQAWQTPLTMQGSQDEFGQQSMANGTKSRFSCQ